MKTITDEKTFELVPRQSLGTDIERLCLALSSEAEPLNRHSQAEPGNE